MPKMKTHRGAAKRFKRTGGGHWRRYHEGKSHLLTHKSSKRKRRLRQSTVAGPTLEPKLNRLMPHQ